MAVKCEKDENHPLGYLHTSFLSASNNSTETGYRFSCTCALVLTFLPTSKNLVKTALSRTDFIDLLYLSLGKYTYSDLSGASFIKKMKIIHLVIYIPHFYQPLTILLKVDIDSAAPVHWFLGRKICQFYP